jgi:flagellar motor component MotA
MLLINGIFLMAGTIVGILLGYAIINYIQESIKYKKYVEEYTMRNPHDEIIVDL